MLIAQWTSLRIIGQGLSGILCGTLLTIGFGVSFGVILGNAIIDILVQKLKIEPFTGFLLWSGIVVGIILGVVSGGFMAR